MERATKHLGLAVSLVAALVASGCHPGGETGDPNVGAASGTPAAALGNPASRPGTPGGPALKGPPAKDPMGGRSGAAAGR